MAEGEGQGEKGQDGVRERGMTTARAIELGMIAEGCAVCEAYVADYGLTGMWPRHKASGGCESGGREHCTCDACF
jgi:hypothetical protein